MRRERIHVKFDPAQVTPAAIAKTLDGRDDYDCAAPDPGAVVRVGP